MENGNPIEIAIAAAGGQSALAGKLGCSPQAVLQWKEQGKAPVGRCVQIERATSGAVTRRDLRPSDWWQIWPELVTPEHPVPEPNPAEAA